KEVLHLIKFVKKTVAIPTLRLLFTQIHFTTIQTSAFTRLTNFLRYQSLKPTPSLPEGNC
ncbi:hypothetical protein, partial [Enterococcus lactis]|uniref:hypothetical protein n=1 Tax=Enterococcus lactis TaxID=357441 RepID=UPI0022E0EB86